MTQIGVREARGKFSQLLDEVAAGAEVAIVRRGKEIARLVPARRNQKLKFPSHKTLRDSIKLKGEPMSETVIRMRREARY